MPQDGEKAVGLKNDSEPKIEYRSPQILPQDLFSRSSQGPRSVGSWGSRGSRWRPGKSSPTAMSLLEEVEPSRTGCSHGWTAARNWTRRGRAGVTTLATCALDDLHMKEPETVKGRIFNCD